MMDKLFDKLDECLGINIPGAVDKMLGIDISDNSKARASTKKTQDNHQRSLYRLRPCIRQSGYKNRSSSESSRHLYRGFDQPDRAIGRHRGREGPPKRVGFLLPGVKEPGDSDHPKVERVPWKDWDEELGASRRSSRSRSRSWDGPWDKDIKAEYSSDASNTRHRHQAQTYRSKNRGRASGNDWDADREYSRNQPKTRRRAYSSPPPPIHRNWDKVYDSTPSDRGKSGDSARNVAKEFGNQRDPDMGYSGRRPRTKRRANSSPPPPMHRNRHNVYEYTTSGRGPSEAGAKDNEYRPSYPSPRYHQNTSAWSDECYSMRDRESSESKPRYFRGYGDGVDLGKKETYSSSGGHSGRPSSGHSGCGGNISQRSRRSATF